MKDQTEEARVQVFAQHFIPTNAQKLYKTMLKVFGKRKEIENTNGFEKWQNIFQNNKELSREFRYVFDRRLQARYQGNTLERP